MSIQYFRTVNCRIEEEKRKKYRGTASLRLTSLQYGDHEYKHNVDSKTKKAHVENITRMFHQEHGCRKEDERHHAKALISQQELEAALFRASISNERLMASAIPYPELEFPTHVKIECLEGHDLLVAAEKKLQGSNKRWIVDLYQDDISEELRYSLADGYDYQKRPDSGEFYVKIKQFQGFYGEANPFFERVWLGRLATNLNSWNLFKRLSQNRKFSAAFDALLDVPSLFGGFRLSVMHQLLGMKCDEPNLFYLRHTYTWWSKVCNDDKKVMRQVTQNTIGKLQGKAPGASSTDLTDLQIELKNGGIFENFSMSQREDLWQRVCSTSQKCLIPSLLTFFEDRKFLNDAAGCIRKIIDVNEKGTIISALEQIFSDTNQEEGKCIIQLSETEFGTVEGDSDRRLDLGIRQLWLAAFRNYRELPAGTQKSDVLALSRTKSDENTLYELANLASSLGFESARLSEIMQACPDRQIAEHALLSARKPGRFQFHDMEGCIQQVIATFKTAKQVRACETTGEATGVIREIDKPPNRYGRPHDIDYQYDKTQLFLPLIPDYLNTKMGEISSTFIRYSVYCAYFGPPPTIENISPRGSFDMPVEQVEFIDSEYVEMLHEDSSMEVAVDEKGEDEVTANPDLQLRQQEVGEMSVEELNCDMIEKERVFDEIVRDIEGKTSERNDLQQQLNEIERRKQELNLHIKTLKDDSAKEQLNLDEIAQDIKERTKERDELQQELREEQALLINTRQERQQITSFTAKPPQDSAIEEHNHKDMLPEIEEINKKHKIHQKPLAVHKKSSNILKAKKPNLQRLRKLPQLRREKLQKFGGELGKEMLELASSQRELVTAKRDLESINKQREEEQGQLEGIRQDVATECIQHSNKKAERDMELERCQEEISAVKEQLQKASNELQQVNNEIKSKNTEHEQLKNNCITQEEILQEIKKNIIREEDLLKNIKDDCDQKKRILQEINGYTSMQQLESEQHQKYFEAEQELLQKADNNEKWDFILKNKMLNLERQEDFMSIHQAYRKNVRNISQVGPEYKNQESEEKREENLSHISNNKSEEKEQENLSQISDDKSEENQQGHLSQISHDIEVETLKSSDFPHGKDIYTTEGNVGASLTGQTVEKTRQKLLGKNTQLAKVQESKNSKQQSLDELSVKLEQVQQSIINSEGKLNEIVGQLQERNSELMNIDTKLNQQRQKKAFPALQFANNKIIGICFFKYEPKSAMVVFLDTVVVEASNPADVTIAARQYAINGYSLLSGKGVAMTAENCFEQLVKDGSYTVVVREYESDEEPREDKSNEEPQIRKVKELGMHEDDDGRKKKKIKQY